MRRCLFQVHVVGKHVGFVLFGLESDLHQFLLNHSAEYVIVLIDVVDFLCRYCKEVIIFLQSNFHFEEVFLNFCEEKLDFGHLGDHQFQVLVEKFYALFLYHHCLFNPLQVLFGLDQDRYFFCLTLPLSSCVWELSGIHFIAGVFFIISFERLFSGGLFFRKVLIKLLAGLFVFLGGFRDYFFGFLR